MQLLMRAMSMTQNSEVVGFDTKTMSWKTQKHRGYEKSLTTSKSFYITHSQLINWHWGVKNYSDQNQDIKEV